MLKLEKLECDVPDCNGWATFYMAPSFGLCGHGLCKSHEFFPCRACSEKYGLGGRNADERWTRVEALKALGFTFDHHEGFWGYCDGCNLPACVEHAAELR